MFSEVLQKLCQTTFATLEKTTGWQLDTGDVTQIGKQNLKFDAVAALHYWDGPVRRLIVGCDQAVANLLAGNLGDLDQNILADLPADEAARIGLGGFCAEFQTILRDKVDWEHCEKQFLVHEANKFQVRSAGAHNYLLKIQTPEGALFAVLDMAPRNTMSALLEADLGPASQTSARDGEEVNIVDSNDIATVMEFLADNELGIQVKSTSSSGHVELYHATAVSSALDLENRILGLTCAGVDDSNTDALLGQTVYLVFNYEDRLLGFTAQIVQHAKGCLVGDVCVPIIQIGFPEQISCGQRRGAMRVEPDIRLLGSLQCSADLDEDVAPSLMDGLPFRVFNISSTGMKVGLSGDIRLSKYKWGTRIASELDLPQPHGTIAVEGEVRRLTMLAVGASKRGVHLSVEFTRALDEEGGSLDTLRDYINSCVGQEEEGYLGMELLVT